MTGILGVTFSRVIKYFMEDYDPSDVKLPNGMYMHSLPKHST